MGVIQRLATRVLEDGGPLDRASVAQTLQRLAPTEAPLLDSDSASAVVDAVVGFGPVEPLLRDSEISDILVNSDGSVWVERNGRLSPSDVAFTSSAAVVAAVGRVISPLGLRLDRSSPAVDARLPDGSRLHAMVPPASVDGPLVAIRRFTQAASTLDELIGLGSIDAQGAELLETLVRDRISLLICGPTGSGKTTLLNILSRSIPPTERVVTIEDAAELKLVGHVVRLEGRPPNSEGAGAITQRQLVRHALRLRPDRLIVGEVRGSEAFDLVQALSTGHEGSMSTIHASSADEAMWRLESLAQLGADLDAGTLRPQIRRAIDVVIVVGRRRSRRVVRSVHRIDHEFEEIYPCS